jgi:ABC-type nitrate/sulfonate/bicarbonate transport system ATPase subunit
MTTVVSSTSNLTVEGVSKAFPGYPEPLEALRDVTFSVADGEFFSVVGPSGCGKSTLLNVIAGLDEPDRGVVHLDRLAPAERLGRTAYMPQKDLLLPWRTVLDNAALGLELTGVHRKTARARAREYLDRFGLSGFADSYPATLSGGMRQRAAFLRTILTGNSILLLDEPFGALDALTRRSMQKWLLDIWFELRQTVILITHDVEEAIFLSDRVAVMSPRPGTILLERRIDLPRPREAEIVITPEFVEIKRDVLAALRSGMEGGGHVPE